MPTGFNKYNDDMAKFEKSNLFKEKYQVLIEILSFMGCKSSLLEKYLKIPGKSIRRLVRHARRCGEPIISSEDGYRKAKSYKELAPTIEQLEDRGLDILVTVSSLRKCFPDENQLTIAV